MKTPDLRKLLKRQRDAATALGNDLSAIRGRLDELANERTTVQNAPLPVECAMARIDHAVDAARDDPAAGGDMSRFTHPNGHAALDTPAMAEKAGSKPLATMCGIMPETIRQSMKDMLAEHYRNMSTTPIAPEDRPKKLAALDSERRDLEVREEVLIREAERAGMVRQRRPDADPSVVLMPDNALALGDDGDTTAATG
jgi:hypothetical protein